MKNRWTIMLALMMCMAVVFAGCGGGDDSSASSSESESASTADVTASDEDVSASEAEVSVSEEVSSSQTDEADGKYNDGTYEGVGEGYSGEITVEVIISGGEIYDIDIISHTDDEAYVEMAEDVIFDIIDTQSTDVDTTSGSTLSANGIIEAVINALAEAEK